MNPEEVRFTVESVQKTMNSSMRQAAALVESGVSRRVFMRRLSLIGGLTIALPMTQPLFAAPKAPVKAAGPEEAQFNKSIVTPSGTALGGSVEVTLRSDGTYKAHFHMHDSGVPDYKFELRALFVASNGVAFAWEHSGKVEGTSSTKLLHGPHRNNDADIEGSHPFIREYWPQVKAGKLTATKEYATTGVIGFVEDAVKDVLEVAETEAHEAAGTVIGLGEQMTKALDSLELGGTVGIIGGVAVLASGGSIVLAVAGGVGAGKMTKALVRQRPLTAEEMAFAERVFGGTLPKKERLILTNLHSLHNRAFTMPSLSDDIMLNVGPAFERPLVYTHNSYIRPGQLLIHELTHAWQIHHKTFVPAWVCSGIITQAKNSGASSYKYGEAGPLWKDFNIEQQGAIVDQWFGGSRVANQTPEDPGDPYFRYIRDNIRAGRV